jgi:hypothetical protein
VCVYVHTHVCRYVHTCIYTCICTVSPNQSSRTSVSTSSPYSQSVKILEYQKPNSSNSFCIFTHYKHSDQLKV